MYYSISEISKKTGINASTLRFYDKEGLIPNLKKVNGKRSFSDKDLEWLRILNCLKNINMPLKEIKKYVDLAKDGDKTLEERYKIIIKQKESLKEQMKILQSNLEVLEYKEIYYKKAIEAGTENFNINKK